MAVSSSGRYIGYAPASGGQLHTPRAQRGPGPSGETGHPGHGALRGPYPEAVRSDRSGAPSSRKNGGESKASGRRAALPEPEAGDPESARPARRRGSPAPVPGSAPRDSLTQQV